MRWYERPHDGAHATDVMAYGVDALEVVLVSACTPPGAGVRAGSATGGRFWGGGDGCGYGSRMRIAVGLREGASWTICECDKWLVGIFEREKVKGSGLDTLMVPVVPQPAAMSSPQYLSLHQEMHHPPSASRFPSPGRAGWGVAEDDEVLVLVLCWRA